MEKQVGLNFRNVHDIRPVGSETTVTDLFTVPAGPDVIFHLTELPLSSQVLSSPYSDTYGTYNLTGSIECIPVDPVTRLPVGAPLTRITQNQTLTAGKFVIKSGTLEADDTYKFGYIKFSGGDATQTFKIFYTGRGSLVVASDVLNLNDGTSLRPRTILPGHISNDATDDFVFPNDVYISKDLHIMGEVNKDLSTIVTTTDAFLRLNDEFVAGPPTADAGLQVSRGDEDDAALTWTETTDRWVFTGGPLVVPGIGDDKAVIFNKLGALHGNELALSFDEANLHLTVGLSSALPSFLNNAISLVSEGAGSPAIANLLYSPVDSAVFMGGHAGGTIASPSSTPSGVTLVEFAGAGYVLGGGGWQDGNPAPRVSILATENWTSTDNGAAIEFAATPKGTVSAQLVMHVDADNGGHVSIGASATDPTAALDVFSTSTPRLGSRPAPSMTTAQKNAIALPANGLMVYDTDLENYNFWDGLSWNMMGGGGFARDTQYGDGITTVFTIPQYGPGSGFLAVFVDGVLMTLGTDYLETDNTHVTFVTAPVNLATLTFVDTGAGGGGGSGGDVNLYQTLYPVSGPNNYSSQPVIVDNIGNVTGAWGGAIVVTGTLLANVWTLVLTGIGPQSGQSGTLVSTSLDEEINGWRTAWTWSVGPSSGAGVIASDIQSYGGPQGTAPFAKRVAIWEQRGLLGQAAGELNWDNINSRLGIGTASPKAPLHVVGLPVYASNATATGGGLTVGAFYRNGADPDLVCVVH